MVLNVKLIKTLTANIDKKENILTCDYRVLRQVNNFFEYVEDGKNRIFIDIDCKLKTDSVDFDEDNYNELNNLIIDKLKLIKDISLMESSSYNYKKLSYRITYFKEYCESFEDMKKIIISEKYEQLKEILKDTIHILLEEKKDNYLTLDMSVYRRGKMRCINAYKLDSEKDRINKLVCGKTKDTLISYISEKCILRKPKKEETKKEEQQEEQEEQDILYDKIKFIVEHLDDKRAREYCHWIAVKFGIFNELDKHGFKIFDNFSKRCKDKYNEKNILKEYLNTDKKEEGIKIGSLLNMLKEDDPKAYKKFQKKFKEEVKLKTEGKEHEPSDFECLLYSGDELDKAKYFLDYLDGRIKTIISDKEIVIFYYDTKTKLYNRISNIELNQIIKDYIKSNTEDADMLYRYTKSNCLKDICETIKIKSKNNNFENELNCSSNFEMPIKGGLIIDLRTGQTRERTQKDYYTFELDIELDYTDNSFEFDFLKKLMNNDIDKTNYLIDILSYCLCGSQWAQSFFVFYGQGSNGKSLLLDIMSKIMDKFYTQGDKTLIVRGKNDRPTKPEFVCLQTKRLVSINEIESDEQFNNEVLKNVSGGDKMPEFRSLYSNEMRSFTSVSKLLLTCNLRPKFNILEHSILRRIKYIHFKSKFILDDNYQIDESKFEYKADVELKDKLSINRFFTLLVNNFKKIYEKQDKLTMCKSCKDEFDNYLIDINPTKGFIKNELYEKEGGKINFKDLFTQYKVYCYDNKITVSGRNVFYDEIRSMLKSKGDYHHGFYVLGYNLISNKNEDEDIQKNDLDV